MAKTPIQYPLFAIFIGDGFLALDEERDGVQVSSLLIFTDDGQAAAYMEANSIDGALQSFTNSAEFVLFLEWQEPPFTEIALNPWVTPQGEAQAVPYRIRDVLNHYASQTVHWDYPVYTIKLDDDFKCIEAAPDGRNTMAALCFFSEEDYAEAYQRDSNCGGVIEPVVSATDFAAILSEHHRSHAAVLDPKHLQPGQILKWVIRKEPLIKQILGNGA